ncbi:transcription elongation regulator 1-like protein isoform X2 [Amphiprion ocellaris]|uniref:transcription elongation regulator 1-like protein isoform X2 n=1 Tax=Amphiprion ocellaris TaxID=80972 RepID=UPI000C312F92|nr:transcription elongation regulator 1-like protein isoform X2 [Amphiprion ocellaris]
MMLPVSRVKGQPVGMVTSTTPWLSISSDPAPQWLWMASWSTATYQATPPLVFYPPAVWVPEHTHLIQWERPAVEIVPLVPPFYQSSPLHPCHPQPKFSDGWISPEEMGVFLRRDKPLLLTNQVIPGPGGRTSRSRLLLCPSRRSGGAYCEEAGLHTQRHEEAWPIIIPNQQQRQVWMKPVNSHNRRLSPPVQQFVFRPVYPSQLCTDRWHGLPFQVMKEVQPSFLSSRFSSRFTLVADCRHNKRGMGGRNVSYGGTLLLRTERKSDDNKQCVSVSVHRDEEDEEDEEEGSEERRKDKRPVASTPVPGSPWCVVWTGDDRVFFFNPTIHLSVWERPGDLIGRDISRIIEDPPHKRKKLTPVDSSCQSSGLHGDDDDDDHRHTSKRNRIEESMSLVPHPGEVKLLPLELRIAHFREMLLERGVSAFSTWEKELHKMVFDPRYLLLTSDQRKQVFDQFVKSRVKDEYKEKRSKFQKAREEFKQLLEEAKITSRSTFKEFCARYCGDQRFNALNRKKEQELLFTHYITSLKKRDKENRTRLRKMR